MTDASIVVVACSLREAAAEELVASEPAPSSSPPPEQAARQSSNANITKHRWIMRHSGIGAGSFLQHEHLRTDLHYGHSDVMLRPLKGFMVRETALRER